MVLCSALQESLSVELYYSFMKLFIYESALLCSLVSALMKFSSSNLSESSPENPLKVFSQLLSLRDQLSGSEFERSPTGTQETELGRVKGEFEIKRYS